MDSHVLARTTRGTCRTSSAQHCLEVWHQNNDYGLEARSLGADQIEITAWGSDAHAHNANSVGIAEGCLLGPGETSTQNLLQTGFYGLALGAILMRTSLGADWARFIVFLNRCEGLYRLTESAVLLFFPFWRRRRGRAQGETHGESGLRRRVRCFLSPSPLGRRSRLPRSRCSSLYIARV